MTSTGQMDPRVLGKCPTFSGRDTVWSEWSFIFESVAAMANLQSAMEGALTGLAEKPFAELTPVTNLSAKQLSFSDQLTEWERRIQEYEGESLETFSDSTKISILASLPLPCQSELWSDWQQVQQVESIDWCASSCQSFFSLAESSKRMVVKWS